MQARQGIALDCYVSATYQLFSIFITDPIALLRVDDRFQWVRGFLLLLPKCGFFPQLEDKAAQRRHLIRIFRLTRSLFTRKRRVWCLCVSDRDLVWLPSERPRRGAALKDEIGQSHTVIGAPNKVQAGRCLHHRLQLGHTVQMANGVLRQ
jgi:hypothetical protein